MQSLAESGAQAHAADSNPQLSLFAERLPYRPYATNSLPTGLRVMPALLAMEKRYVQYNGPATINWLCYDIDRAYVPESEWRHVPPANILVRNPENGHAHVLYGLGHGVTKTSAGRAGPLRLVSAVSEAFRHALDADTGFAELICKNPLHPHWQVETPRLELYDLHEMCEWVDLPAAERRIKATPKRQLNGAGRNCSLFDSLRTWGYKAYAAFSADSPMALDHKVRARGFDAWEAAVQEKARNLNVFANPLPDKEVRTLAGSVAKWIWRQYTGTRRPGSTPDDMTPEVFALVQSNLGRLGNLAKWGDNSTKQAEAVRMAALGCTQAEIAADLEVNQATVSRWLKVAR